MNEQPPQPPEWNPSDLPSRISPIFALTMSTTLLLVSFLVMSLAMPVLIQLFGLNATATLENLSNGEPTGGVNFMRTYVGVQQFGIFFIPAMITVLIAYRSRWWEGLGLKLPKMSLVWARVVLLWLFSMPLTAFLSWINLKMSVPQGFEQMNELNNKVIEYVAQMHTPVEVALVVFLLAIVPAVAEELFFRGIIQTQSMRLMRNPAAAIGFTAVFFAAFHMEFSAMLPRVFLGILLGSLFYFTRSLWTSMVFHAINNAMSVWSFAASGQKMQNMQSEGVNNVENHFWWWLLGAAISWTFTLLIIYRLKQLHEGKLLGDDDDEE